MNRLLSISRMHTSAAMYAMSTKVSATTPKTAILMLNMGGPKSLLEVEPFLRRLFLDRDIINLPIQNILGPLIARRRAPAIIEKYREIGGGSPIRTWTDMQGRAMAAKLDQLSPQTGPHKHYIGFRYVEPLLEDTIEQIERDNVSNVIAFSQYAQYCCNTSGSSINAIAKYFQNKQRSPSFHLSFIDRWSTNSGLISTFTQLIEAEVRKFPPERQQSVLLLFTAHSLPLRSVNVGDTYTMEVSATVMEVMKSLSFRYPFRLVWQSKVGPLPWQGPQTSDAIKGFVTKGFKNVVLIPISFVNEHIETLHELDIEYCDELVAKHKLPIENIRRCPAPNDHPEFINGLVNLILEHMKSGIDVSPQLLTQCPLCEKQVCADTRKWLTTLNQNRL